MSPFKPRHADAGVISNPVQTGAIILTGVGGTFVDVLLTARPSVAPHTVTGEGAVCVHALASVLTWISANTTLISVNVTCAARVTSGTVAVEHAADGVGVTVRALSARVTDASVISMAQQTGLSMRAEADEGGHSVDARGARAARCRGTVVNVLRAVRATPAIDADAHVTAR